VSQRICQSLCTDLTAPWAAARSIGRLANARINATQIAGPLCLKMRISQSLRTEDFLGEEAESLGPLAL
jgi:hypothetical protein